MCAGCCNECSCSPLGSCHRAIMCDVQCRPTHNLLRMFPLAATAPLRASGVTLDIQFEVSVVAGAPASWSVAIVERFHTTTAAVVGGRQQEDDLSMIPCGKPFTLEIEALDVNHNRCGTQRMQHLGS